MADIQQVLGLDVGTKRTGIARASMIAKIPEPLQAIETINLQAILPSVITQYNIDVIVVGLPRSLEGNDTDQTKWLRGVAEALKSELEIKMFWQDEALSTIEAVKRFDTQKVDIDSASACIILEDFVNSDSSQRVEV